MITSQDAIYFPFDLLFVFSREAQAPPSYFFLNMFLLPAALSTKFRGSNYLDPRNTNTENCATRSFIRFLCSSPDIAKDFKMGGTLVTLGGNEKFLQNSDRNNRREESVIVSEN